MNHFLDEFPVLTTDRLILRKIEKEDAEDLYAYYANPNVTRYLNWAGPKSVEHAREVIQSWSEGYEQKNFIRWAVTMKERNIIIGTVETYATTLCTKDRTSAYKLFTDETTGPAGIVALGYELSEAYWNQGIMTEAIKALIRFTFHEIQTHRIEATVDPENIASLRVLKKLHFQEEGLFKKYSFHTGRLQFDDRIMLALLADEYYQKEKSYE